jgi:flagellar motor protein MotB
VVLAEICADHRAAFERPGTFLRLTGHASTTGPAEHNLQLSADRAAAVYEALRALIGPAFAVAEASTFIGERGEYDALEEVPDETETPEWRRVDVWLDAEMLVGMT